MRRPGHQCDGLHDEGDLGRGGKGADVGGRGGKRGREKEQKHSGIHH